MTEIRRLVLALAAFAAFAFAALSATSVPAPHEESRLDAVPAPKLVRVGATFEDRTHPCLSPKTKAFAEVAIRSPRPGQDCSQ